MKNEAKTLDGLVVKVLAYDEHEVLVSDGKEMYWMGRECVIR